VPQLLYPSLDKDLAFTQSGVVCGFGLELGLREPGQEGLYPAGHMA
jgi:hypothetical protein